MFKNSSLFGKSLSLVKTAQKIRGSDTLQDTKYLNILNSIITVSDRTVI
jgi:hypothetical protein